MSHDDTALLAREIRYLQKALDRLVKRVEALEQRPGDEIESPGVDKPADWSPRQPIYDGDWVDGT